MDFLDIFTSGEIGTVCTAHYSIDKRFGSVEAKIKTKMNCRIFDTFDLTGFLDAIEHAHVLKFVWVFNVSHSIVLMYIYIS